jgi:predicted nucleic acid-binding protein
VILLDTSAWAEFLRATGSGVNTRVRKLVMEEADIVTTDVVVMEVLAGARDETDAAGLGRLLGRYELVPITGLGEYEEAAAIYRTCRRQGEPIRTLVDCLIAAVAIRADAAVLHRDRDFEAIARHTPLRLAS